MAHQLQVDRVLLNLFLVHAVQKDRHRQCCRLIIRDRPVCIIGNEILDFIKGQFFFVPFFANDIDHVHNSTSVMLI